MARGGLTARELRAIKMKAQQGKKIGFNNLKIYLMNKKNERTGTYFTAEEAASIANSVNRKYKHKFPYNGGRKFS